MDNPVGYLVLCLWLASIVAAVVIFLISLALVAVIIYDRLVFSRRAHQIKITISEKPKEGGKTNSPKSKIVRTART